MNYTLTRKYLELSPDPLIVMMLEQKAVVQLFAAALLSSAFSLKDPKIHSKCIYEWSV